MLNAINEWMEGFKDWKNEKAFELVEGLFCDGLIIPKLPELFKGPTELKVYLGSEGKEL